LSSKGNFKRDQNLGEKKGAMGSGRNYEKSPSFASLFQKEFFCAHYRPIVELGPRIQNLESKGNGAVLQGEPSQRKTLRLYLPMSHYKASDWKKLISNQLRKEELWEKSPMSQLVIILVEEGDRNECGKNSSKRRCRH